MGTQIDKIRSHLRSHISEKDNALFNLKLRTSEYDNYLGFSISRDDYIKKLEDDLDFLKETLNMVEQWNLDGMNKKTKLQLQKN